MKKTAILIVIMMLVTLPFMGAQGVDAQENITVTDARGEEISFDSPPERIISFMPSNTEILFHLDLGDRVIGVDSSSDYPHEVNDIPEVGGAYSVDYEKIADLQADVVVVPSSNDGMIKTLENDYDQTVVATHSTTVQDVYKDMHLLGEMCGVSERGEEKATTLEGKMGNTTSEVKDLSMNERPDVFYLVSIDPTYTPGSETFQNTLLKNAGMNNVFSNKTGWAQISHEGVIKKDPEVMIAPESIEKEIENLTEREAWKQVSAVKNDNVYFVDSDEFSRPGPRIIDAQERLVNITKEVKGMDNTGSNDEIPSLRGAAVPVLAVIVAMVYRRKRYEG